MNTQETNNTKDVLAEIHKLEPTFSLSDYLEKLKEKKQRLDRLKGTLAWKIQEICRELHVDAHDREELHIEVYKNHTQMRELLSDNIITETVSGDVLILNIKINDSYAVIADFYEIDEVLNIHKKQDIDMYYCDQ